jgi:uncharacterized protein (DUF2249 family)
LSLELKIMEIFKVEYSREVAEFWKIKAKKLKSWENLKSEI